jgi:hypothetical protein
LTLPHRFPFRLVDQTGATARLLLSADAYWQRGRNFLDLPLLIEAAAQASALLAPSGAVAIDELLLAGVSDCELVRPARIGETLEFEVSIQARLGTVVRVGAVVRSAGEEIARLKLTLIGTAR